MPPGIIARRFVTFAPCAIQKMKKYLKNHDVFHVVLEKLSKNEQQQLQHEFICLRCLIKQI